MKKILYGLLLIIAALFVACDNDLPQVNFELYELKSLEATVGDMSVTLNWQADEKALPSEYLILWKAASAQGEEEQMTVAANELTATLENLKNDVAYTISVQPRYTNGLASKSIVSCMPKNARYPITDLIAAAGSEKVRLTWKKPASERGTKHQITVNPGGKEITVDDISVEMYVVNGLTNGQKYTFSVVTSYPTGNSDPVEVSAIPGQVEPILANKELVVWESAAFAYNDMYFMAGEVRSALWDFGDGSTSTELKPTHAFAAAGVYPVSLTVTYSDNTTETGSLNMTVTAYKWGMVNLNFNGLTGHVKTSNPVFSPDGRTLYIPTSSPAGHLFAIDVVSGQFKWSYAIGKITYGGGALVGPDGTIYQCVRDKSIENVYAIHPNGTKKWALQLDGPIGAFPALSDKGILYCLTNKSTLYALNAADGSLLWEQALDGATGSAVAIDKAGNVYAGTSNGIYAFSATKQELWKLEGVNVTEQGTFALVGNRLFAALKASAGIMAVNMSTGKKEWTYPNLKGDAYFPVIDKEGTVYFTEKGPNVYAVTSDGQKKWIKDVGYSLTYNGAALSADGVLYVGTNSGKMILGLDTSNGNLVYEENVGQQVMSAVTIGPDRRLYCGTIGTDNVGAIKAFAIRQASAIDSWSVRGGNMRGTNQQQ